MLREPCIKETALSSQNLKMLQPYFVNAEQDRQLRCVEKIVKIKVDEVSAQRLNIQAFFTWLVLPPPQLVPICYTRNNIGLSFHLHRLSTLGVRRQAVDTEISWRRSNHRHIIRCKRLSITSFSSLPLLAHHFYNRRRRR